MRNIRSLIVITAISLVLCTVFFVFEAKPHEIVKRPDFVWHHMNKYPDEFIGWGTGAVESFFSSPKIVEDDEYFVWCALKDGKNVKLVINKGSTHSITTWFTVAQHRKDNIVEVTVYDDPVKAEVIIRELLAEIENIAGFLKSADFVSEVMIGK